jgi:general secretion pathway protein F
MASFRWSAINAGGEVVSGVLDAPDRSAVVERLQHQGHVVLRAELADARWNLADLLKIDIGRRRDISRAVLGEVTRELAVVLLAGQNLDRALRFVIENVADARARAVLGDVRDKVRSGSSLAAALMTQPGSFPRLYIGLVRAGEAGGTLAATLARLADLLERERSLKASLRAAMIYPAILVITAVGSIVLLLDYVLPQFVPIFEQAGAELPFLTRTLMTVGKIVGAATPWFLLCALAAIAIAPRARAQPAVRSRWDRLVLHLPIFGRLLRETLAARFTRTLGTLLQNGMPLVPALAIARDALGNVAAADAVDAASVEVKAGRGLARPLGAAELFPARTVHLLQLGEETAQLAEMSLKAADIHDEHARLIVQRMVALAIPVITILMGVAVAGIVGSLITAMLSLNDLAI